MDETAARNPVAAHPGRVAANGLGRKSRSTTERQSVNSLGITRTQTHALIFKLFNTLICGLA